MLKQFPPDPAILLLVSCPGIADVFKQKLVRESSEQHSSQ